MKDKEPSNVIKFLKDTYNSGLLPRYGFRFVISTLFVTWIYLAIKDVFEYSVHKCRRARAERSKGYSDLPWYWLLFATFFRCLGRGYEKLVLPRPACIVNERSVGQQTQQYSGDKNRFEE